MPPAPAGPPRAFSSGSIPGLWKSSGEEKGAGCPFLPRAPPAELQPEEEVRVSRVLYPRSLWGEADRVVSPSSALS